jgi:hypothetical protein
MNMSGNISAPITLNGFFGPDSDDDDTDINAESTFSQIYEVTVFHLGSSDFKVRQFSWHRANGNQVMEFTCIKYNYTYYLIALICLDLAWSFETCGLY